jgi:hypothetical protein
MVILVPGGHRGNGRGNKGETDRRLVFLVTSGNNRIQSEVEK